MRFFTDQDELIFEDNPQYPANRPSEMMQVIDRSAGGVSHVETYAMPVNTRTLNFSSMNHNDYIGLFGWFTNVANGMANTFSFEDERGAINTVRFLSRKFSLEETRYHRYTGSMTLEIIQ